MRLRERREDSGRMRSRERGFAEERDKNEWTNERMNGNDRTKTDIRRKWKRKRRKIGRGRTIGRK